MKKNKKYTSIFPFIVLGIFSFTIVFQNFNHNEKFFWLKLFKEKKLLEIGEAKLSELSESIERTQFTEWLESMEMYVVKKPTGLSSLNENCKELRKNLQRAFQDITLEDLDASENLDETGNMTAGNESIYCWKRINEFALYSIGYAFDRCNGRGMIVRKDDSLYLIDEYLHFHAYPHFYSEDFDKDGKKEQVIIIGGMKYGTGWYVDSLFLLDHTERDQPDDWDLYSFEEQDYLAQIRDNIIIEIVPETYQMSMHTSDYCQEISIDLSEEWEFKEDHTILEKETVIGDILFFDVEDHKIKISFDVALVSKEYATPLYFDLIPRVEAEVSYQDGSFQIKNMKFHEDTN